MTVVTRLVTRAGRRARGQRPATPCNWPVAFRRNGWISAGVIAAGGDGSSDFPESARAGYRGLVAETQVWWAAPADVRPELVKLLNPVERTRRERYMRDEDRDRFTLGVAV